MLLNISVVCPVLQVLGRMKQAMVEHSSSASHSFLLDDDSTLPFVANEILAQMDDKVGLCWCRCSCMPVPCVRFAHLQQHGRATYGDFTLSRQGCRTAL